MPIVKLLISQGHKVTVLAPPDSSVSNLKKYGCDFVPLEMNAKGLNPMESLRLVMLLSRKFKQLKPDIILSYTIKNNIFGALAARYLGIPFIPNVSGLGTAFLSGGFLRSVASHLYKLAFRGVPVIFFQNNDDLNLFVSMGLIKPGQARTLPGSGIDLEYYSQTSYPVDFEPIIFIMIARLLRDKGTVEFVEAARQVKKTFPQARFQLLGDADSENRSAISSDKICEWVSQGVIEYLGTTHDVRPFIFAAHCVVLPSYREGSPRTLMEAASMARPLIATDVPGCRSVVENEISGLLCKAQSSESLATAILNFLALSADDQRKMGIAGRRKMEREYDKDIVVRAYAKGIHDVITQKY